MEVSNNSLLPRQYILMNSSPLNSHSNEIPVKDISMYASWCACNITRISSNLAFKKYGRSVLTTHMLEEIGASYDQFIMKH
jgi:ATP-dependent NAD(P)H-hydrate dehydratase